MANVVAMRKSASVETQMPFDKSVALGSLRASRPADPPQWFVKWHISEPLFVTAAELNDAQQAVEAAAAPAELEFISVELELTLELYGLPKNWDAIVEFYIEAFEDVPPDLVVTACKRLRLSPLRFFPKPGEIRAHIVDDLEQRKRLVTKMRLARRQRRDPEEWRPPTEREKAEVDALVRRATNRSRMPA